MPARWMICRGCAATWLLQPQLPPRSSLAHHGENEKPEGGWVSCFMRDGGTIKRLICAKFVIGSDTFFHPFPTTFSYGNLDS